MFVALCAAVQDRHDLPERGARRLPVRSVRLLGERAAAQGTLLHHTHNARGELLLRELRDQCAARQLQRVDRARPRHLPARSVHHDLLRQRGVAGTRVRQQEGRPRLSRVRRRHLPGDARQELQRHLHALHQETDIGELSGHRVRFPIRWITIMFFIIFFLLSTGTRSTMPAM